jgi:ABC-type hemin transport system substrate-binding protein
VGQAEGRPLLPSMIKSVKEEEFDADTVKEEINIKEEEDPTQQFIDELDAVQHDLQQEQEAKKLAKRAKKEKKAAKKAKKEAKKKRRMDRESDGGEKRIKVEMSD